MPHILTSPLMQALSRAAGKQPVMVGDKVEPRDYAVIDLSMSFDEIWSGIRKSYRPLIHWGEREMTTRECVIIDGYRLLHESVAGLRYPWSYWDVFQTMLNDGRAAVQLAWLGEFVAGVVSVNDGETAYYASASAKRDTTLPLTHYPLWRAISAAKERELKTFDLGDVSAREGKEGSIAFFKRGFTKNIVTRYEVIG